MLSILLPLTYLMARSNIMPSSPVEQERTKLLSDGDDLLHYSKKVTGKPHSGAKYCRKSIGNIKVS